MNWYKKSIYEISDWELIRKDLQNKLGRNPTPEEIQKEMLERLFNTQKEPSLV